MDRILVFINTEVRDSREDRVVPPDLDIAARVGRRGNQEIQAKISVLELSFSSNSFYVFCFC